MGSTLRPGGQGDSALAVLAAQLHETSRQLGELEARLRTAEAAVAGQGQTLTGLAALGDEVRALSGRVEALGAAPGAPGSGGGDGEEEPPRHPRVWAVMTPDEHAEALRDLARWVTSILLPRYPHVAPDLPPCWPAHPAVVEELDWLYWAWTDWATGGGRGDSRDAGDWHDRWLPGVLDRIRPDLKPCTAAAAHKPPAYSRSIPQDLKADGNGEYPPDALFVELTQHNPGPAEKS